MALAQAFDISSKFLYGQTVPTNLSVPLILLLIYVLHLLFSAVVLYYAVKVAGGKVSFPLDFSKAVFTIFIRDLIALPLIFIAFAIPFFGLIVALFVWLGLIKHMFQLPWTKTIIAFIASIAIPLIVIMFLLIPLAMILLPGVF